jgi:N-acetylmuramoyl-L-alanine amidase CwlA
LEFRNLPKQKKRQQGHVVQSKRNVASHLFKKKRKQKQKGNGLRLWTTELI